MEGAPRACAATVADVVYLGSMTQYIVDLPTGERLVVHRLNDEVASDAVSVGDRVSCTGRPSTAS